jgi:predicted  nucleic acid-binding Zn-ribbon protein
MEALSYSLHLSNDRNKTKKARQIAKSNETNTTSFSNNAIQNHQQLSKVDKHNLRKYDEQQVLICTIRGTSSIVEDTKNLYLDLFEDARIKYNEKQNRNDRKIENYFNHISNDNKRDLACEIIIEIGDMDFWAEQDDKFKKKMIEVFKEQSDDLEKVVPNFKIANATIHFDESSPHLHIVGVPFKDGAKNGMERQVGKSDVFTKESLHKIQDTMREYCINSFNKIYELNYTLKEKEEGRNQDINVKNMQNYRQLKKDNERNKKRLKELNAKADNLQNKSNQITNIIDNLKPSKLNKNNFTISNEDIKEIKNYIEQTTDTTTNLKNTNDLTTILEKYEEDLKNHSNEVKSLQRKIKTRDDKIEDLSYKLTNANDEIDELEDKVSRLQEALNYFKDLWKKFIEFLQDKFFFNDKYDKFIDDLYNEDVISDNDLDIIHNNYKSNDDDLEL